MGLSGGCIRDNSVEILLQSFLQEALVSSSGMGRDVHSLITFVQLTVSVDDKAFIFFHDHKSVYEKEKKERINLY